MDRMKLMDAIAAAFQRSGALDQRIAVREMLKRIPDMDLIVLAQQMDIDTDALVAQS